MKDEGERARMTTRKNLGGSLLVVVPSIVAFNQVALAGGVVEYDNFYPEQCTAYAQNFFRVLTATGTVALRCTWAQALIDYSQVGVWKKAFDDAGLYTEYNPLLEHRDISHQVTYCLTLDHRL